MFGRVRLLLWVEWIWGVWRELKLYVDAEKGCIVVAFVVPDALVDGLDADVVCELQTVGGFKHCLVAKVVVGIVDVDAEGVVNLVGQDVVEEYSRAHVSLASEVDGEVL